MLFLQIIMVFFCTSLPSRVFTRSQTVQDGVCTCVALMELPTDGKSGVHLEWSMAGLGKREASVL